MARKRTPSGRARIVTPASKIYLQAEKINKRIRSLEKNKMFGSYKSKELIQFVRNYNSFLLLSRNRGSKRFRLKIKNLREATAGQIRLITKKLRETLRAKGFSPIGIKGIRKQTRQEVAKTLGGMVGRELSDKDTDLFYEIIKYKTDEIISKIGPSEFYVLVDVARQGNYSVDAWVNLIDNYIEVNNESIRKACEYLYYKFVA